MGLLNQISPVCLWRYVGASALGLFPTQLISVYLGTTVRSMEEVLVDENTATVGYGVLILQVSKGLAQNEKYGKQIYETKSLGTSALYESFR
ncbi:uncharacterized protein TNCV_786011 [Trichonephila clavipes]|nr:uncharacterized protein TNCV_786011 [Trichonephila clavipes]